MTEAIFESSDSVRSARPLAHAQTVTLPGTLPLARGGRLERVRVAYETYGRLNERRDNAVLICHALSGDSHVAAHDAEDDPGWWDVAIGPGKGIDTDRCFVICPNILGGCRGTTGPNTADPLSGRPYGPDFPEITVADMVEVQRRLLDSLGIERLLSVVGGSLGGMQVLQWAVDHPGRIRSAIPIATCPQLTSQALAFDVIGRNAITHDPNFRGGYYYDLAHLPDDGVFVPAFPVGGLAIARMIGHITYLSREAMRTKFGGGRDAPREVDGPFEKDTNVASYLAYQGRKFVERFDANSYLAISRAMDAFDLGEGEALARALAPAACRWLAISFTSDWLFPPEQSQQVVRALVAGGKGVSYANVESSGGHDAFLLDDQVGIYGELVRAFLANAGDEDDRPAGPEAGAEGCPAVHDTSIFHGRRLDYDMIERLLIEELPGDSPSVLDLGCGDGQMLLRLKCRGWTRLQGVEVSQERVLTTVQRGIDCIHADLNAGLGTFGDGQFDGVLLSRTLQAVHNVTGVIDEMLRVGRRCIVSVPNFAYRPLREMLARDGRAPEGGVLPYKWYDTPNIRFFSLTDFQALCRERGLTIHRQVALNTETHQEITDDPNLNADLAIFVLSRP